MYNIIMKIIDRLMVAVFVLIIIYVLVSSLYSVTLKESDDKYYKCLGELQVAIPDANDLEGRSKFIRDCLHPNNEQDIKKVDEGKS